MVNILPLVQGRKEEAAIALKLLDDKWKAAKDDLAALQATSDDNDASLAKLADVANAGDQINTVCNGNTLS